MNVWNKAIYDSDTRSVYSNHVVRTTYQDERTKMQMKEFRQPMLHAGSGDMVRLW